MHCAGFALPGGHSMQHDPVVVATAESQGVRDAHYAADDAHDWPEDPRLGRQLTSLAFAEYDIAPTYGALASRTDAIRWLLIEQCRAVQGTILLVIAG
jgi:hypothetical protein